MAQAAVELATLASDNVRKLHETPNAHKQVLEAATKLLPKLDGAIKKQLKKDIKQVEAANDKLVREQADFDFYVPNDTFSEVRTRIEEIVKERQVANLGSQTKKVNELRKEAKAFAAGIVEAHPVPEADQSNPYQEDPVKCVGNRIWSYVMTKNTLFKNLTTLYGVVKNLAPEFEFASTETVAETDDTAVAVEPVAETVAPADDTTVADKQPESMDLSDDDTDDGDEDKDVADAIAAAQGSVEPATEPAPMDTEQDKVEDKVEGRSGNSSDSGHSAPVEPSSEATAAEALVSMSKESASPASSTASSDESIKGKPAARPILSDSEFENEATPAATAVGKIPAEAVQMGAFVFLKTDAEKMAEAATKAAEKEAEKAEKEAAKAARAEDRKARAEQKAIVEKAEKAAKAAARQEAFDQTGTSLLTEDTLAVRTAAPDQSRKADEPLVYSRQGADSAAKVNELHTADSAKKFQYVKYVLSKYWTETASLPDDSSVKGVTAAIEAKVKEIQLKLDVQRKALSDEGNKNASLCGTAITSLVKTLAETGPICNQAFCLLMDIDERLWWASVLHVLNRVCESINLKEDAAVGTARTLICQMLRDAKPGPGHPTRSHHVPLMLVAAVVNSDRSITRTLCGFLPQPETEDEKALHKALRETLLHDIKFTCASTANSKVKDVLQCNDTILSFFSVTKGEAAKRGNRLDEIHQLSSEGCSKVSKIMNGIFNSTQHHVAINEPSVRKAVADFLAMVHALLDLPEGQHAKVDELRAFVKNEFFALAMKFGYSQKTAANVDTLDRVMVAHILSQEGLVEHLVGLLAARYPLYAKKTAEGIQYFTGVSVGDLKTILFTFAGGAGLQHMRQERAKAAKAAAKAAKVAANRKARGLPPIEAVAKPAAATTDSTFRFSPPAAPAPMETAEQKAKKKRRKRVSDLGNTTPATKTAKIDPAALRAEIAEVTSKISALRDMIRSIREDTDSDNGAESIGDLESRMAVHKARRAELQKMLLG